MTVSLVLFSLCVLSDSWELTRIRREVLPLNTTDWRFLEIVKERMFIVDGDSVMLGQPWHQNSLVLAATHSGLWRTCLSVSLEEYRDLLTSLPWLGDRCVSLSHSVRQETGGGGGLPPWLRVMNISISCCLTSLIIVTAALVLGLVGMFYKQATCLLVDCVLMLISVFFFLLSLSLHWAHRHQRTASLSGSSQTLLVSQPAWSQYLGQ